MNKAAPLDGTLFVAGVSFKTAPVALREQLAVAPTDRSKTARCLMAEGSLDEAVLLWTCNRVEIYGVTPMVNGNVAAMFRRLANVPLDLERQIYCYQEEDAVEHLFRVTSGLDSMVLGETEITGQVKTAYEESRKSGLTGKRTNRLFQKALKTAKEVRRSTGIGKGAASVGSVAVQHAHNVFGRELQGRKVMVIGAGRMAEKCLHHLRKRGVVEIDVVNRSVERAEALADRIGGTAVSFGRCLDAMVHADIVITSTGCPHILLEKQDIESVMSKRNGQPLFIIDIAVPRDVASEAGDIPGVYLHDIGHLEETVRANIEVRQQDLDECRAIIDAKVEAVRSRICAIAPVNREHDGVDVREKAVL